MSRTRKRPYTGSKAIDASCRNHGSCPWCKSNRTYKNRKHPTLEEALEEYKELYGGCSSVVEH